MSDHFGIVWLHSVFIIFPHGISKHELCNNISIKTSVTLQWLPENLSVYIFMEYPTNLRSFILPRKNFVHFKISCRFEILIQSKWRYEIHTGLSFILLQFIWTQVKSWLNTEVRFSAKLKSHTDLNSFRRSCKRALRIVRNKERFREISIILDRDGT